MENYIVSARKYRPSTFAQVVGQESITSTLKSAIINGHIAQAFLFTGPRGVGKTTCARILAKTINCLNPTADGEPCNNCESCNAFNNNASFNIHELDAASNNSVEDIRALVDQVRIPPQAGNYKVYIIDEVHMLSTAAFNAFLKTLEEPPSYAKFILATTEKHKIIPTILSRCQIFDFKRIGVNDIAKHLEYIAKSENIEADKEALHIIAEKSDGALRDALSTFDQIVSYSGNKITFQDVIENLNILDHDFYFRITASVIKRDISEALLIYNEINERGFDGQQFLTGLTEHFRNLLVVSNKNTLPLLQKSPSVIQRYSDQAAQISTGFLFKALEICNKYDLSYKNSNNKRLHVEIALTQLISSIGVESNSSKTENGQVKESVTGYKKSSPPDKASAAQQHHKEQNNQPEDAHTGTEEGKKVVLNTVSKKTSQNQTVKNRPIRNISIKSEIEAIKRSKEKKESGENAEVIDNPFTQEQLEKAWNNFVEAYKKKSPNFTNTIAKAEPKLEGDNVISYKVPNIIISADVLNVSVLKNFLIKELNNNQIKLKPLVAKKKDLKEAYTDRERFEELQKQFPKLNEFKEKFRLELEF